MPSCIICSPLTYNQHVVIGSTCHDDKRENKHAHRECIGGGSSSNVWHLWVHGLQRCLQDTEHSAQDARDVVWLKQTRDCRRNRVCNVLFPRNDPRHEQQSVTIQVSIFACFYITCTVYLPDKHDDPVQMRRYQLGRLCNSNAPGFTRVNRSIDLFTHIFLMGYLKEDAENPQEPYSFKYPNGV